MLKPLKPTVQSNSQTLNQKYLPFIITITHHPSPITHHFYLARNPHATPKWTTSTHVSIHIVVYYSSFIPIHPVVKPSSRFSPFQCLGVLLPEKPFWSRFILLPQPKIIIAPPYRPPYPTSLLFTPTSNSSQPPKSVSTIQSISVLNLIASTTTHRHNPVRL